MDGETSRSPLGAYAAWSDPRAEFVVDAIVVPSFAHLVRSFWRRQDQIWFPSSFAAPLIHSRYSVRGVTPVSPPQPSEFRGPVDQLTTPMIAGWPSARPNTGPPESPVQAPSPGLSPRVAGSCRRICKVPGWPVAIRLAARTVPPDLPSPRTVTP